MPRSKAITLTLNGNDNDNARNSRGAASASASGNGTIGNGNVGQLGGTVDSVGNEIRHDGNTASVGGSNGGSGGGSGGGGGGNGGSGGNERGGSGDSGSGNGSVSGGSFRINGNPIADDNDDSNGSDTGRAEESEWDGSVIASASGRHKRKQCPCPKCSQWRISSGTATEIAEPENVTFDTLTGRARGMSKDMTREVIGIGLSAIFETVPMFLPPDTAGHWPLSETEERTLTKRIEDVLAMLPKRTRSKGMAVIAKIFPPIALVVTAGLIVKPRIDMTRDALKRRNVPPNPNWTRQHERQASSTNGDNAAGQNPVVGSIPRSGTESSTSANGAHPQQSAAANVAGSGESVADASNVGSGNAARIARNSDALRDPTF